MSGNCAIGSCTIATAPSITVRIEITIATMGRRTKNEDTGSAPGGRRGRRHGRRRRLLLLGRSTGELGRGRRRRDDHAGASLLEALDDDAISRGDALADHLER